MKKYILVTCILMMAFSSCSKGEELNHSGITASVKGKICWEDGTPAAGIQVSDGFSITRTDAQGCYSIEKRNVYAQWVY